MPYDDNEAILRLIDIFEGVQLLVEDEFKKSEKMVSYKVRTS